MFVYDCVLAPFTSHTARIPSVSRISNSITLTISFFFYTYRRLRHISHFIEHWVDSVCVCVWNRCAHCSTRCSLSLTPTRIEDSTYFLFFAHPVCANAVLCHFWCDEKLLDDDEWSNIWEMQHPTASICRRQNAHCYAFDTHLSNLRMQKREKKSQNKIGKTLNL